VRIFADALEHALHVIGVEAVQRGTVARQRDRGRQHAGPGQLAVLLMHQRQASNHARDAGRARPDAPVLGHLTLRIQVHVAAGGARCHLAIVDAGAGAVGEAHHHEAAATDVAGGRVRDSEREADRHGSVDRVAPLLQDRDPHVAGCALGAAHRTVRADRDARLCADGRGCRAGVPGVGSPIGCR
jgi:hypothetical protein